MVADANVPLMETASAGGESIVSRSLMVISAAVNPTPTSPQSMRIHPVRLSVFTTRL